MIINFLIIIQEYYDILSGTSAQFDRFKTAHQKYNRQKEKRRHILIYNFKVYLVMVFCVAVVTLYSKLTGSENSVVGVTVLLAVLVLRQADFGIKTTHGLLSIAGILEY